jgi:purine-binding chemotaxis protein CheW
MARTTVNTQELIVFQVGDILCGTEILHIQEINKQLDITPVHHAPSYVRGVLNLRGQIITVIDLRKKFNIPSRPLDDEMRIVIVRFHGESIGLLVDGVQDVLRAEAEDIEPSPGHLSGISGAYFAGIYKMPRGLVAILNFEGLLACKGKAAGALR